MTWAFRIRAQRHLICYTPPQHTHPYNRYFIQQKGEIVVSEMVHSVYNSIVIAMMVFTPILQYQRPLNKKSMNETWYVMSLMRLGC